MRTYEREKRERCMDWPADESRATKVTLRKEGRLEIFGIMPDTTLLCFFWYSIYDGVSELRWDALDIYQPAEEHLLSRAAVMAFWPEGQKHKNQRRRVTDGRVPRPCLILQLVIRKLKDTSARQVLRNVLSVDCPHPGLGRHPHCLRASSAESFLP